MQDLRQRQIEEGTKYITKFYVKFFNYHWVLVALETRTMIAYYLDSLEDQPSDDLKEIVNV